MRASRQAGVPGPNAVRDRLARLSSAAGARRADGTLLRLRPHDCRRVFASEHLDNNTPVQVIQALLGHATPDTVMIYAKLYPARLVEEYRKALRGAYLQFHGEDSLRNPTQDEWRAFEHSCSMRDMGTHLCALPTGEHCPKRPRLPRLHARATETQRDPYVPRDAHQPSAGADPLAERQRAGRTDRRPGARDQPHSGSAAENRRTHRGRRGSHRGLCGRLTEHPQRRARQPPRCRPPLRPDCERQRRNGRWSQFSVLNRIRGVMRGERADAELLSSGSRLISAASMTATSGRSRRSSAAGLASRTWCSILLPRRLRERWSIACNSTRRRGRRLRGFWGSRAT